MWPGLTIGSKFLGYAWLFEIGREILKYYGLFHLTDVAKTLFNHNRDLIKKVTFISVDIKTIHN